MVNWRESCMGTFRRMGTIRPMLRIKRWSASRGGQRLSCLDQYIYGELISSGSPRWENGMSPAILTLARPERNGWHCVNKGLLFLSEWHPGERDLRLRYRVGYAAGHLRLGPLRSRLD